MSNKTWPEQFSGTDPLGDYNGTLWHWQTGSIRLETSIRQYASAVVFSLAYPDGATGTDARSTTTTHSAVPSANFPAFSGANNATARPGSLGYLSWHGNMCNHTNTMQLASVSDGGQDTGGPVVLYDRYNESVVVVSALNNFMTAQSTVNQPGLPSRNGKHEMIFGAERLFCTDCVLKPTDLPRQALDKHRKSWNKEAFLQGRGASSWSCRAVTRMRRLSTLGATESRRRCLVGCGERLFGATFY